MIRLFFLLFLSGSLSAKSYVTADFLGRLGNNLFQIAAAVSIALDEDAEATFPKIKELPVSYQRVLEKVNKSPILLPIKHKYREPFFHYAKIPYTKNMCLHGYFQSEKYFVHHKDEIIDLFSPSEEIEHDLLSKYQHIINHPNSVAVHVRCYFSEGAWIHSFLKFLNTNYFEKALSIFPEDSLFVFFSDDMNFCKKTFQSIRKNVCFIENESVEYDFYLMTLCKHNIISNSTFSWWGAYLNRNPDKIVVAPYRWMQPKNKDHDVIPESWIKIDGDIFR